MTMHDEERRTSALTSRERGAVSAGDPQTVEAGCALLRAGGNAVDAAIGAAFASFVCEAPLASAMGGAVVLIEHDGEPVAYDAFGRAPGLGLSEEELRERRLACEFEDVEVDFGETRQVFHVGVGSTAVPLALPGLVAAQRAHGVLPLARVVEPAVALARSGYRLSEQVAYIFSLLEPIVRRTPGVRAIYDSGDALAQAGAHLDNSDLAAVLEELGRDPGAVMSELYAGLQRVAGLDAGGLITREDCREVLEHELQPLAPVSVELRGGRRLITMAPPSVGGVLVGLGARLLDGTSRNHDWLGPKHMLELARVQELLLHVRGAGTDFDLRLAEPAAVERLLSSDHVESLQRLTRPDPEPQNPLGSTTHVSAVDALGTAVAITLSNGEGAGVVVPGTGTQINNLLGEEDINPRGFHVEPPGRVLSTMMAPTLLDVGRDSRIALGSGGSNRLRNAIQAVACHLLEHNRPLEEAVLAPRLHLEARAGTYELAFESRGLSPDSEAALRARYGDRSARFESPHMFFGGVHVAAAHRDGHFEGAGDARRGGVFAIC